MAKLKIYTFPDVVLTQKAAPIARVEKTFHRVADDMLETMYDAPGIGLAANQVGLLDRIIVVDTEYETDEEAEAGRKSTLRNTQPIILINPEVIHKEGSIVFNEGCLSVPEYNADVKRAEKIKLQYQDIDGLTKVLSAEGLLAICLQHEIDHLDGKLFIDRLSPLKKEMARKKLREERAQREADARAGILAPPKKHGKGL